jgi:DtxR family Mn-dependent transcriptional regulator
MNSVPPELVIATAAIALVLVIFWPHRGLLWLGRRLRRQAERIVIEDALKHLHDRQTRQALGTIESLAGVVGLRRRDAADLAARMERGGLIRATGGGLRLTPQGEAWALQVVRAHRLSERYLSDEVGVALGDVHRMAEQREHMLTPAQADRLETQLGHPRFDPHGDPIPAPGQVLQPAESVPLTDWPIGTRGRIAHVEDEPPVIFTQILAEGLLPDTIVEVAASDERGLHIRVDGHECWLAAIVAANIFVEPPPERVEAEPLSILQPNERGTVVYLKCGGLTRRRLMDLGLVPGTRVQVVHSAALGEPHAYRVRETVIALRREQAEQILVRRSSTDMAEVAGRGPP